jgi:thioredoxin-like negative regulator of GroEL
MKCLLFTSSSCKACPQMKLNLKAAEIEFVEMNVDTLEATTLAGSYRVKSLPTLVILVSDTPVESFVGVRPVYELQQIMGRYGR